MSIKQFPGGIITKNPTAPTTAAAKGIWTLGQASNYAKQGIWPRSPGAPTIGTATAGSGAATVAYTAPTDLGAGTVTYTATSSPGGLTGTGASPITVSGLTNGTAYTFTVTASTPGGTSPASAASNSVTPALPAIGAAYEGGFYAGQISTAGNGVADYNLVIGPVTSAQNSSIKYKNANTATAGADSVINGTQNTADMVADGNSTVYPAAHFCNDLVIGGFSDWYMPAKNELEVCYYNLKATTTSNNTAVGTNTNAVPSRGSNYTAGTPAQTSATAFQTGNTEAFANAYYWSSTEASNTSFAWTQFFQNGGQSTDFKTSYYSVRAIRRVAV
jgi:hypothetical protein